jgi:hypothetical protein
VREYLGCDTVPASFWRRYLLQIQAALGATNAIAFDITSACSGFVVALVTAAQFIRTGARTHIVVVGADALSRNVDWNDRGAPLTLHCDKELSQWSRPKLCCCRRMLQQAAHDLHHDLPLSPGQHREGLVCQRHEGVPLSVHSIVHVPLCSRVAAGL